MTFVCDSGYALSGSQYVTCSSTQTWTPGPLPQCLKTNAVAVSAARGQKSLVSWLMVTIIITVQHIRPDTWSTDER